MCILCKVTLLYGVVMQIEERNVLTKLFDIYGNLLSNKQFEVFDKYLNYDIGESELGELYGESRQSIHDAIAKAKKQLFILKKAEVKFTRDVVGKKKK